MISSGISIWISPGSDCSSVPAVFSVCAVSFIFAVSICSRVSSGSAILSGFPASPGSAVSSGFPASPGSAVSSGFPAFPCSNTPVSSAVSIISAASFSFGTSFNSETPFSFSASPGSSLLSVSVISFIFAVTISASSARLPATSPAFFSSASKKISLSPFVFAFCCSLRFNSFPLKRCTGMLRCFQ